MTGPATLNDETDVRMAFYVIQEATARFSVIHIIPDKTANADLPIICTFVAVACPDCLFCQPNRDQRERHNYGPHGNHPSFSRSPNFDKTNMTPSHWRGSDLQNFKYIQTRGTYIILRRKALISLAWSLYIFRTTSSSDVTCISCECHMPGKEKESIVCDLDLGNEVYYHRSSQFQHPRILTDLLAFRNSIWGTFLVVMPVTYT